MTFGQWFFPTSHMNDKFELQCTGSWIFELLNGGTLCPKICLDFGAELSRDLHNIMFAAYIPLGLLIMT